MPTEIIDLCSSDDDDDSSPLPVPTRAPAARTSNNSTVQNLRIRLASSERARTVLRDERTKLSERTLQLEQELAETRRQLAALQSQQQSTTPVQETHESSSEIIRCLNHDLEGMTRLSAENYSKFQNAQRIVKEYQSVVETLWSSVECPVCFEPIWEPAAYPCGHTVCQGCATQMCAYCRAPTQGIIKVYALRDVVRTIAPLAANVQSPRKPRR